MDYDTKYKVGDVFSLKVKVVSTDDNDGIDNCNYELELYGKEETIWLGVDDIDGAIVLSPEEKRKQLQDKIGQLHKDINNLEIEMEALDEK